MLANEAVLELVFITVQ